jgi:RNA polymerase sigma-70 factor (ECF subfamily)
LRIDANLVDRLYRQAKAGRWRVPADRFARALEASAERALGEDGVAREVERYLASLHLEDLALACACAHGDEQAWEHFVLVQRPLLYRAADAIDPGGGARDLADSLYADLFGIGDHPGERQSLFRYFHGRSSLTTWLRAVLAQRHVDRLRRHRRLDALPEEESAGAMRSADPPAEPERDRYVQLIRRALTDAVAGLQARDRLRLACYYAQELTLAQTGRMLGESEATSSRQLARTRGALRAAIEHQLKAEGLSRTEIGECFASVAEDAGPLDLHLVLGNAGAATTPRKKSVPDRSG